MRRALLAAGAALSLLAGRAEAAIAVIAQNAGTGVANGSLPSATAAGVTSISTGATTVDIPTGSLVAAAASIRSTTSATGCTDPAGNTYKAGQVTASSGSGQALRVFYSLTTADLPVGSKVTCSSATTANMAITAVAFSGVPTGAGYDGAGSASAIGGTATGTLTIGPTGTTSGAPAVWIGALTTAGGTSTEDSANGFTNCGVTTASSFMRMAYKITSVQASTSYAPSQSSSGAYAEQLQAFDLSPNKGGGLLTLGIGG